MYNPLKPDAGPSPLLDAPIIQVNFSTFAAIFSRTAGSVIYNHTALNSLNQGNHEVVLIENQAADPGIAQTNDVLYNKNAVSNVSTQPQLFLQIPKFLPTKNDPSTPENTGMQVTYNTVNIVGPVYQSFLVGGYLIYFGVVSDITVPVILSPIPTSILIAIAEPNVVTAGFAAPFMVATIINNVTHDRFTIVSSPVPPLPYTFTWMAIGKE